VLKADNPAIFTAATHAQRAPDFINGLQPAASDGSLPTDRVRGSPCPSY
jgi:antirestriction protein ArdC